MIRRLVCEDKEIFIELAAEFYASDAVAHPIPREYHVITFEEIMRSDVYASGYLLLADEEPAGYALTAKTFAQEAGGIALWIDEIYVRPAFRSRGLGRAFFAYLQHEIAGSNVRRLRLEVEPENEKASRLYQQLGFTPLAYRQLIKELW